MSFLDNSDVLYVCVTCRKNGEPGDPRQGRILFNNLKDKNPKLNVKPVKCLAGCKNGVTLSLWNKEKWSYIIGNLKPHKDEADIIEGFEEYRKTLDGKIPFSKRPRAFKGQSLARIPPLNYEINENE